MWLITSEPPRYLCYYISLQGAATLFLYGTLVFYDESTYEYAHIWGLCTILLSSAYLTLAHYFLTRHQAKVRAILCSAFFSFICSISTYRHLARHNLAAWLGVGAVAILAGTGIILCGSAVYHSGKNKLIAFTLGILFIAQSLWNIGFVLHSSQLWDKANYVLPTMLCLGAWGYLGMKLRNA